MEKKRIIKKGKSKKDGKEKDNKKEQKKDNTSNKENKNDENQKLENSNHIMFNGNDITVGNIPQKKSTIQILMEISTEMESLSSHIDKTIPIRPFEPVTTNNYNYNDNYMANMTFHNELSNRSKLNNNFNQIKSYEDKCCQSEEDNNNNEYYNQEDEKEPFENNNINYNNINEKRNEFPYDPNRHLGYYNYLKNNNKQINSNNYQNRQNNNYGYNQNNKTLNSLRVKKMDELYNLPSNTRKQPIIYTQPQSSNNTMRSKIINKYEDNFGLKEINRINNRNGQNNINNQQDENEIYENNNKNDDLDNNNNFFNENNYSNNNNYINDDNNEQKNYENKLNNQDNNNDNINLNYNNYENNENKYERFRPKSINQAMNILLDKE